MNFANVRNNEIIDFNSKYLDKDITRVNVSEDIYQAWLENKGKVIFDPANNKVVLNPYYEEEKLKTAKEAKYNEATDKAKAFIDSGEALYELDKGTHIEATDGNIGKFSAYAIGFLTGEIGPDETVEWCTAEDKTVYLTQEGVAQVLKGLGQVQAEVWTVKFPAYVEQIEAAETVEDVEKIEIDYKQTEGENYDD